MCYMSVCVYVYTHRAGMFFLHLKECHLRTFHFMPGQINVILKNHRFVPIVLIMKCNIWQVGHCSYACVIWYLFKGMAWSLLV